MFLPAPPIGSTCGIVHSCISNLFPRRLEKTAEHVTGLGLTSFQDPACIGNFLLKSDTKLVGSDVNREAKSAISLSTPATGATRTGAACASRCIMPKPRRSLPAVGARERSAIRSEHATVGELSENINEDRCRIFTCCSSTENCSSTAACSKSELVSDPWGFESDTT